MNVEEFELDYKDKIKQHKVESWMLKENTIKAHLKEMKASDLRKDLLVFSGHPLGKENKEDWDGYDSLRSYYLQELRNRGKKGLEQLGWDTDLDSFYVNLHTGDKETLEQILIGSSRIWNPDSKIDFKDAWTVIEHWIPFEEESYKRIRIKYLKEQLKNGDSFENPDDIKEELVKLGDKIGLMSFFK